MPSAAFLSAGGYHHHVGLNSWQSEGGDPAPASAPGLRGVRFELSDAQAVDSLEAALAEDQSAAASSRAADGAVTVRDPDGQLLEFATG